MMKKFKIKKSVLVLAAMLMGTMVLGGAGSVSAATTNDMLVSASQLLNRLNNVIINAI